jgi:hypothetical protein
VIKVEAALQLRAEARETELYCRKKIEAVVDPAEVDSAFEYTYSTGC